MKKKIFCILMSVIASLIIFGCSNDVNSTQPTESTTNKPGDDIVEPNTTEKNDTEETSTTEHKHEYNEVIVEATCDKKGSKTFTCKTCNDTYSEEISALEHSYNVTTSVNATCTSKGSKTFTCSKCSHTYIEDVAMLAHNWKNATCTTAKACSVCGEKSGTALGHSYSNGTCSRCGVKDPATAEKAKGAEAYVYLQLAEGYCDLFSDMIYDAWYFAIYKEDDYYTADSIIAAFSSYVGIDKALVSAGVDSYLNSLGLTDSSYRRSVLATNNGALYVVDYALSNNDGFKNALECINSAKTVIQSMDRNYTAYNGFTEVSSYYSAVKAYYDFCYSPSGSFSQLSGTLNTFRSNCNTYRSACSLYFE